MADTNHGSIEFLKFPNPQYPGDRTKLIKKWLRDSWARKKIAALQQAVSSIVVPTKTSQLQNDSGYITSAPVQSVNGQTGAVSLDATDVGALPDTTVIPSKTSQLTNDAGFITASSVPSASSTAPAMDGTGAAGASADYARADHVHPHDTSKQDALSAAQMEAVNSGITASKVSTYDALTTLFDVPIAIPSGADLNNYMTPGHYTANTGSIAGSLVHSPAGSINFSMFVFYRTETRISQLIIPASASLYIRYEGSSGLESWRKISTTAV